MVDAIQHVVSPIVRVVAGTQSLPESAGAVVPELSAPMTARTVIALTRAVPRWVGDVTPWPQPMPPASRDSPRGSRMCWCLCTEADIAVEPNGYGIIKGEVTEVEFSSLRLSQPD